MSKEFRPNFSIDGPGEMTNGQRADRAGKALTTYIGWDRRDPTNEMHLQDLLCDLMHLAHRDRINFGAVLASAEVCHIEERG